MQPKGGFCRNLRNLPKFATTKYKANVTDALVVFEVYRTIWEKNTDGLWVITRPEGSIDTGNELLKAISGDSGGGSDSGDESLSNAVVAPSSSAH